MSRDLLIALLTSLAVHGGLATSDHFTASKPDPAPAPEVIPTLTLTLPPLPPEEPEKVEARDPLEAAPAEALAPSLVDMPSLIVDATAFVQKVQAPPPPGPVRTSGAITLPTTRPGTGAGGGLANLFDLANLDQKPAPRFVVKPIYPFDLQRSGLAGKVTVRFIVDSEGHVRSPQIIRSTHPGFEEAALTAIGKWTFKPGRKGGAAVNTQNVQITLEFSVRDEN